MTDTISKSSGLGNRRAVMAGVAGVVLLGVFSPFLIGLLRLSAASELYSHLPLIPLVCGYLVYIARGSHSRGWGSSWLLAGFWGILGMAALAAYFVRFSEPAALPANDVLFWPILSMVLFTYAVMAACFGGEAMRRLWFELLFLVLMIPMPTLVTQAASIFLQYASADALELLLTITGTTFYRDGLTFAMPGLTVEVALECSGIRSTLVLLVTGLLAGHLFLDRPWKKTVLILAVVPLGILRNAFRITAISLLTIHVDERVIHGPIHKQGGPFFFVLSLILLFALVFALRAIGRKATTNADS